MGAPVSQDGLSSPTEPRSTVSALTGFDPSRWRADTYEGKPRHLPSRHRREIDAVLEVVSNHIKLLTNERLERLFRALSSVSPANCSWQHYALAKAFIYEAASAIEAREGEDSTEIEASSPDESAVPQGDAQ